MDDKRLKYLGLLADVLISKGPMQDALISWHVATEASQLHLLCHAGRQNATGQIFLFWTETVLDYVTS